MSKIDTGTIRLKVKAKATYNIIWLEKTILECAEEIDRLIGQCEMCLNYGEGADVVQQIEQQTKEACIKRIKQEKWLGKWDVETLEQAIDSVGGK